MKNTTSKVAHEWPNFFFQYCQWPKTSPNLNFCSMKTAHCATYVRTQIQIQSLGKVRSNNNNKTQGNETLFLAIVITALVFSLIIIMQLQKDVSPNVCCSIMAAPLFNKWGVKQIKFGHDTIQPFILFLSFYGRTNCYKVGDYFFIFFAHDHLWK